MPIIESKEAARYSEGSPDEHCGICIHYEPRATGATGTCEVVSGEIHFNMWCRHFRHASGQAA